jgi:hypothetical protein
MNSTVAVRRPRQRRPRTRAPLPAIQRAPSGASASAARPRPNCPPSEEPSAPNLACFFMARQSPENCEERCREMGMSLQACRNPFGSAPVSVVSHQRFRLVGTADAATGNLALRIAPRFLGQFLSVITGSFAQTSHPDLTELNSIYAQSRLVGMAVTVENTSSDMENQGSLSIGVEPACGASVFPTISESYVSGLPGAYSGRARDSLRAVATFGSCSVLLNPPSSMSATALGSAGTFSGAFTFPDSTWHQLDGTSTTPYVRTYAQTGTLTASFPAAAFTDCIVVAGTALELSAPVSLVFDAIYEFTPKNRFTGGSPGTTKPVAGPAEQSIVASDHFAVTAMRSWNFAKMLSNVAMRTPGLSGVAGPLVGAANAIGAAYSTGRSVVATARGLVDAMRM